MSRNKKIQFFNMIEVLLALVVIAIGMSSVLGLFPVGLNASRNSIAENVSADVADQMVTYLRVMGESDSGVYDDTFTASTTDLPDYAGLDIQTSGDDTTIDLKESSTGVDVQTLSDDFLTAYKTGDVSRTGSGAFRRVADVWAIFQPAPTPANLRRRVYFIVQGPNCTEDGGNRNIDYSAMALVWKSPIQINRWDGSTWNLWPDSPADDYTYSGQINIELSWPLVLPYSQRKKRYYQIVISKPTF